ncbi:MAG TPA: hypothetical protein DDY20_05195 [Desulfobulbaceae bacterium]|nr:hypothetical protein [Desulfobulbaceae bacterium]
MSSGEQQLQADFALVKKLLQEYPSIKLVATKGDPPEQYDIEYNLKGFKTAAGGTILPANKHLVRIALPFGYPHFPPTAKPLSPIFHPDIDPDAIRIADFWKESKSLPKLIIHIGQMICGTFYSTDPFNQSAFDWFEERKSWLPFDILEPHEGDEEEAFIPRRGQAGKGAATAEQPPTPLAEETGSAAPEEEIPLDFALPEPGREAGEESAELDNLLDGEFSHAFDLDEQSNGTTGSGVAIEDLTGLQDESPSLDLGLGLELELEQPMAELQTKDLTGEEGGDFNTAFDLAGESSLPKEEGFDLGDLAGLGQEDLDRGGALAMEEAAIPELHLSDDFALDFSAAEVAQVLGDEEANQELMADDGLLGGLSLQLDEDHGKTFADQVDSIRPLIERKEIFTAKKVLASVPDPRSIPDREELELTIAAAISEAEEMYKKADKLEQKGELEKAGLMLDLVANIAMDYPGLDFARNRIRESVMAGGRQKTAGEADVKAEAVQAGEVSTEKPAPKKIAVPKLRVKIPYRLLGVLLAVAGIAGGGTALYLKDNASLAKARAEFNRGQQLVQKLDFKEAEKAFTTARSKLGSIILFARGGKNDLSQAIDAVVGAESFKEGLQGKVLSEGEYVTVAVAMAIDSFTQHAASAEQARQDGNIDQAIISYEKSLEYAEQAGKQDKTEDIRQKISALRLQQTMALAKKAEEDKEWNKAADTYQQALELSGTQAKPEEQADIAEHHAEATLRHAVEEGKRAFTSSEWQKAVEMLQRAKELIVDNPTIIAEPEQQEINKLLINASFYQILANAKISFAQQDWDGAVKEYDNAVALLRENEGILGQDEVTDSIGKIEKTVLMTKISREQSQIVQEATDSGTLAANLEHFRAIASIIEKSTLKNDAGLQEMYKDAKVRIANLEKEILINGKKEYLKERYETIFRENYPSAKSSELVNPQVTFVKREGNVLIFTMSCAERSQGRIFRLELNYQYDLDKGAWSLYPGKL